MTALTVIEQELASQAANIAVDYGETCSYFAMCANPADGVVVHPIIGYVPTCERCADHVGVTLHKGSR